MTDKRLPDGAWRPDGVSGADEPKLAIGQWYWVSTRSARGEIERDLRCLTSIGFQAATVLVYDGSRALTAGPPPDFEAYRARLNATLRVGSVTVGQEIAWERREAERENNRERPRGPGWHRGTLYRYRPEGDPGPGRLARVAAFAPRARSCTFRWTRVTRGGYGEPVAATIAVPAAQLLNVDAYQRGDFRQFFADPRTRAEYLKWAPLLLAAEDYRAGKTTIAADNEVTYEGA